MKKIHPISVFATFFWLALSYVIFKYMRHYIHEPDIWWHLAHGRMMVENRCFLRTDVFSHTLFGTEWINFEWLSQVLLYLLVKIAGIPGLYVWKVTLGMMSVCLLSFLAWRSGARGPFLFLLTWLGYHLLQVRLCTRVELSSLNLLSIFVLIVLIGRDTKSPTTLKILPWLVFILMMLWCNLHAGFIYGLGFLFLFSIGARWARYQRNYIGLLDRLFTVALVATLINPFGPRLIEVFLLVAADFKQAAPHLLLEWDVPTLRNTLYFWATFLICSLLIMRNLLRKDRSGKFWTPVLVIFMFYGSKYIRNTPLLGFVAVPFISESIKSFGTKFFSEKKWRAITLLSWLACPLALWADSDFLWKPLPAGIIEGRSIPAGSCRFIQANGINGKMYNPLAFGGYIDWALGPERKVFMDGRYIFYPLLVEEQDHFSGKKFAVDEQHWAVFFEKYRVDYAIARYEPLRLLRQPNDPPYYKSILNVMFPEENWALVYWDDSSLVFLKRLPQWSDLIKRFGYRFVHPYNMEQTLYLATLGNNKEKIKLELERHEKQVGASGRASWLQQRLGVLDQEGKNAVVRPNPSGGVHVPLKPK